LFLSRKITHQHENIMRDEPMSSIGAASLPDNDKSESWQEKPLKKSVNGTVTKRG
jgi:hypothetical protein